LTINDMAMDYVHAYNISFSNLKILYHTILQ